MFESELAFAGRAFTVGNLAASELVCRNILDTDPRNAAALNQLGLIAKKINANEQTKRFFEAALQARQR